ncbi:MAG: DUF1573 domain-containing protein [Flavobacteriaceae bacterium]|nr:DUF1573 domain-containing protein [Flavobacteriaceae bacterium]
MKRIGILSILCLSIFVISCKEDPTKNVKKENIKQAQERDTQIKIGGSKISFDKSEHDFGVIEEGDIVETVFTFTNLGKSELIIFSAKGTCGCTVPEWPKEPILPGERGEIKVKFSSKDRSNKQQKSVTIATNADEGEVTLVIKAQVTPKS